ncbi:MAG: hypothetical protein V4695_10750 [Pseudomonadota bacterium]
MRRLCAWPLAVLIFLCHGKIYAQETDDFFLMLIPALSYQNEFNSKYISASIPDLIYNTNTTVSVTMRNDGTATWLPGVVSISNDTDSSRLHESSLALLNPVFPGQQHTFSFTVRPEPCFVFGLTCHEYIFSYQLVQNGQGFGERMPRIYPQVRFAATTGSGSNPTPPTSGVPSAPGRVYSWPPGYSPPPVAPPFPPFPDRLQ